MKRICCIGLCFVLAGNVIPNSDVWDDMKGYSEEETARYRELYKNSETLKGDLMSNFTMDVFIWDEEVPLFKEKFGISDNILRAVLMDIYESVKHVGKDPFRSEDSDEIRFDKRRLHSTLEWLGYCADKTTKDFLMKFATDTTKDNVFCSQAIMAYLRNANAKECDWITTLLADRSQNTSSIYQSAMDAYDEAVNDAKKRKAIVAVVSAALVKEEKKHIFTHADRDLAERDKDYSNSPSRRAALQRMDLPLPPEPKEEKKPWWKFR